MGIKYPTLIVQDLNRNPLCLISYGKSTISELEISYTVNETSTMSFRIGCDDFAAQYLVNENLILVDNNETYIIKGVKLEDNDDVPSYVIECEHEFGVLKDKQLPKLEYVAETVSTLVNRVLEGTNFSFTGTDIPNDKLRHLYVDSGDSVFSGLVQIANNFSENARLKFETFELPTVGTVRGVGIYMGEIDNGRYFKKTRDLQGVDLKYDTSEMITKLEVFGENDKVTNTPINMMSVHPEGKTYVENYDYFIKKGITLEQIKANNDPRFVKEFSMTVDELRTPQQVYDYALDEIKMRSIPLVECNCTVSDLSQFDEYLLKPVEIFEKVYIIDERINFEAVANIISITKKYDNPLDSDLNISNVVEKKSVLRDLSDSKNTTDNVINADGTINGGFVADGTFHANKLIANTINANHIETKSLTAECIASKTITAEQIQTGAITAGSGIIAEGAIGNAEISELSANKLSAGTIDTSIVDINGDGSAMRIRGNQILAIDNTDLLNQKVKAIFGEYKKEDNTTTHGLAIYGKNGSLMIDEDGVHKGGIIDNSIENSQISPDANIDGSKLNIKSTITAINNDTGANRINSVKIDVDGKTLSAELKEYNDLITENSKNIQTNTSKIQANAEAISLKVSQQNYLDDKQQFQNSLSDISNKIDGLQVGGNNLLVGTKDWTSSKWDNVDLTGEVYVGGKIAKVKGMYPKTPSTTMSKQQLKFKIGEAYTIQIEAKAKIEGLKLGVSIDSTKINYDEKVIDHTQFVKYTWTFVSGKEDLDIFRFDSSNATDTNYIEIAKCKVELGSVATDWTPSYDDIYLSIEEAKQQIADIVADDKLTANEKYDIKREIDAIKAEKIQVEKQGLIYPSVSIILNNYISVYNSLINYISPLISASVINETSLIDPDTFRNMFNNYYDVRSTLLIEIDKAAKKEVDDVKAKAEEIENNVNLAQGELDDIQNINKLTPSEKQNMKLQWEEIKRTYGENIKLLNYYDITGSERVAYERAYDDLNNLIPSLIIEETINITTDIDGVDVANKQVLFYETEAIISRIISQKIKLVSISIAESSLQEAKDYSDGQINELTNSLDELVTGVLDGAWKDGLIDEIEAITIKESIKNLDTEKADVDKSYTKIYANANLLGTAKTTLKSKYTSFTTAHNNLVNYINSAISDGIATDVEYAEITRLTGLYNTALADYKLAQIEALDNIALNQAKKEVSDMKVVIDSEIQEVTDSITGLEENITNAVKDGVIDEAEKMILSDNLKKLATDKASVDKQYTAIYSNSNLTGTAKSYLYNAKSGFDTAYNNYINYINTLISKAEIIETDITELNRLKGLYDTAFALFLQRMNEALDNIATNKVNAVKSDLDDIIADDKFTPNEKTDIDRDLQGIKKEYEQNIILSTTLGITTEKEEYITAYNNLLTYLQPLLSSLTTTSTIVADTFKAKFTDYFDKRSILMKKINDTLNTKAETSQATAEEAKEKAEEAMGEINYMGSDSKITPVEKLTIKDKWEEIKKEYTSILNQAKEYSVSTTTYTSYYNTLNTYLNGTDGLLIDMSVTTSIVRSTYQARFNNYYTYRQNVLDNIAIASKKAIGQAVVDSNAYTDGQVEIIDKQFAVVNSEIKTMKDSIALTVTKDELQETVTTITNNQSYKVEVFSSKGTQFINRNINTILMAVVYRGREDVTSSFDNTQFVWTRTSADTVGDTAWNNAHVGIGNTLTITSDDFAKYASFDCVVVDKDGN